MGKKDKNKKQKQKADMNTVESAVIGRNGDNKVIKDPRFEKVYSDPRFQKVPKKKSKVAIDSRFNAMFSDERFSTSSALFDKRGKRKQQSNNALKRYYRLDEEEGKREEKKENETDEEVEEREKGLKRDVDADDESGEESDKSNKDFSDLESSDESGPSEAEDEDVETDDMASISTDDEVDDVDLGEDTFVEAEDVPEIDKETHRLAVVNMDWNQVKADDLFILLSSFLPKGGQIVSVAVYPSEFGLQRMQEEAVHGPIGLFDNEKKDDSDGDDDDDEDEIDNEKLRAYERSRLKYYYAVVECDSIATADYLYKTCDGAELERSANKLDLRFIPDSLEFKHPPRDVAKDIPTNYEPLDFQTRALQHSNILLSWDDDEPHRAKTLRRRLTADQLDKMELEEFLASTESDEDEDSDAEDPSDKKNKKRDKYRALLDGGGGSGSDEEDQEMEVTFNTGLEDISKKILGNKNKQSETVWEAYLRRKKEKKKESRNKSRPSSDDDGDYGDQKPVDEHDDFFEEDTPVEKKKGGGVKKNGIERDGEAEASRAELELLMADETGAENKPKVGKDELPTVVREDSRFSALFSNPLYALDPTDPQFKRSVIYAQQLAQRQHKGQEEPTERAKLDDSLQNEEEHSFSEHASSSKDKYELSSLVKSIKMKSKQIVSSGGVKKKTGPKSEKRKKHDGLAPSKKKARV